MAKKVKAVVKLAINAGKANPAPPIGPALAQHGINLMQFCKEYNVRTADKIGEIIPAEITIFTDGSFKFVLKSPPTSFLLKKAAGIKSGAKNSLTDVAGRLTKAQIRQIANEKIKDMNAIDIEGAMAQVAGTARQMGIEIVD